jgi:hypothetical protein
MLDLVELMSSLAPGCLRKRSQILQRAASELDGLHTSQIYKILYRFAIVFRGAVAEQ